MSSGPKQMTLVVPNWEANSELKEVAVDKTHNFIHMEERKNGMALTCLHKVSPVES